MEFGGGLEKRRKELRKQPKSSFLGKVLVLLRGSHGWAGGIRRL